MKHKMQRVLNLMWLIRLFQFRPPAKMAVKNERHFNYYFVVVKFNASCRALGLTNREHIKSQLSQIGTFIHVHTGEPAYLEIKGWRKYIFHWREEWRTLRSRAILITD